MTRSPSPMSRARRSLSSGPTHQAHLPSPGVNAFLYQVAPNVALRNSDLPTRAPDGTLLQRPQAALDLFYLITFYGDDLQLEQQRLLGAVTLALHAQPWLKTADIVAAQGAPYLAGADLANQTERVRFRPINFSLEELSKLWSFLLKTDYVLSAAYVASVVLIDTSDATPPPALPVLQPKLVVLPVRPPVITAIAPVAGPGGAIVPGAQINVIGVRPIGPCGLDDGGGSGRHGARSHHRHRHAANGDAALGAAARVCKPQPWCNSRCSAHRRRRTPAEYNRRRRRSRSRR